MFATVSDVSVQHPTGHFTDVYKQYGDAAVILITQAQLKAYFYYS